MKTISTAITDEAWEALQEIKHAFDLDNIEGVSKAFVVARDTLLGEKK